MKQRVPSSKFPQVLLTASVQCRFQVGVFDLHESINGVVDGKVDRFAFCQDVCSRLVVPFFRVHAVVVHVNGPVTLVETTAADRRETPVVKHQTVAAIFSALRGHAEEGDSHLFAPVSGEHGEEPPLHLILSTQINWPVFGPNGETCQKTWKLEFGTRV